MATGPSTSRRILPRVRSERGLALPVVMGSVVLMLIFLATASTRATIGLNASSRDVASKRALQTAKAGMRVAIQRQNSLGLDLNQILNPTQQCLIKVSGVLGRVAGSAGNWCPLVSEDLGTGASFSYRISAVVGGAPAGGLLSLGTTSYQLRRTVVASGTVDGVTRRVAANLVATASRSVTSVLTINLISSGTLQLYRVESGSFRECSGQAVTASTPSPPDSGC